MNKKLIISIITGIAAVVVLVGLLQFAFAPPTLEPLAPPPLSADARPLIIDTDMGMDDVTAILFLLGRPEVDIKAIIVDGNGLAHCDPGVQNARGLVALGGRPSIPVACGAEKSLSGTHAFPEDFRTGSDDIAGLNLPLNERVESRTGLELLAQTLAAYEAVDVLALGAHTNLALVLIDQPELAGHIRNLTVMGGAVRVPGNTDFPPVVDGNPYAEFNLWIDPEAARQVFATDIPLTLVPLDATNDVPLTMDFVDRLGDDQQTGPAKFIYEYYSRSRGIIDAGGMYFWDQLAAAVYIDESLVEFETISIEVIAAGSESGRTLVSDQGRPVRVAFSPDSERFLQILLDALNARN